VPQEPYIAISDKAVVFYYVNNIVFAYKKQNKPLVNKAIKGLKKQFKITDYNELKWFLGIHILRDRQRRCLWLSQFSYIKKIANKSKIDLSLKPLNTLIHKAKLTLSLKQATQQSSLQYQSKVGSILYAAITTRPDIAFAASKLTQFNTNLSQQHYKAADRVLHYLYSTHKKAIGYRQLQTKTAYQAFLCASDASFADNSTDRKSSQGYIITLFGGPIT
jgi:hypothetical protein